MCSEIRYFIGFMIRMFNCFLQKHTDISSYLICFVNSEHESPKSLKLKISYPFTISQEEVIEYSKAIVMRASRHKAHERQLLDGKNS